MGARPGDTLVLVFDLHANSVTIERIGAEQGPWERLAILLGQAVPSPMAALSRSLGCRPDELAALLERRGEGELIAVTSACHS